MKLLPEIPIERYNDVPFVLEYLRNNPQIGNEDVEPIQYFHCFWAGSISDLHLMCLESLNETHPNCTVLFWTPNAWEVQGSFSWIKIKRLFKDKIILLPVSKELFESVDCEFLYSTYSINLYQNVRPTLVFASEIIRFIVLEKYGGIWFDLDILFLRNFDSIKLNRYVSQWGTNLAGNTAIMRLEKNHNLTRHFFLKNNHPFDYQKVYDISNGIDLTIIPSTFFDIHWQTSIDLISFKTWDEFFQQEELNLPSEIYAYHWHNRWEKSPPPFYQKLKQ